MSTKILQLLFRNKIKKPRSEPAISDDLITKHYISFNTFFFDILCLRLCFKLNIFFLSKTSFSSISLVVIILNIITSKHLKNSRPVIYASPLRCVCIGSFYGLDRYRQVRCVRGCTKVAGSSMQARPGTGRGLTLPLPYPWFVGYMTSGRIFQ